MTTNETNELDAILRWLEFIQRMRPGKLHIIKLGVDSSYGCCLALPGTKRIPAIRRHLGDIAKALGAESVTYVPGEYHASGRGAFGRLGGSDRRGYRSLPSLRITYARGNDQ